MLLESKVISMLSALQLLKSIFLVICKVMMRACVFYTSMIDVTKSNIAIIWTRVFEWHVVRCGSKNGHQKTCI